MWTTNFENIFPKMCLFYTGVLGGAVGPAAANVDPLCFQNCWVGLRRPNKKARRIWLLPYQRQFRKEIFIEAK